MMSLWPSRGLELHGVEIKISRADWRREAADPRKAEAVGQYCDRWWLHTAPSVIDDTSELPPLWGWREFDGTKWTTRREAAANPTPAACNRRFLAALLRRADESMRHDAHAAARRAIEADRELIEQRVQAEIDRRSKKSVEALDKLAAFEAASGISLDDFMLDGPAGVGALVKMIKAIGLTSAYGGIAHLQREAARIAASLQAAMDESGFAFKQPYTFDQAAKPKRGGNGIALAARDDH